ncbi:MAG: diguanylate cyclase [Spirochaetales bacterium]|nr:diguanylate cyclase [Spirochaetales bacterium]
MSGESQFYFSNLNKENGLSHSSVSAVVQDSRGFLWIGTQYGLNRYDGREFLTYEYEPFNGNGLPDNQIQTLYMGKDDILWIGTYAGLSRFDINSLTFTNYASDPSDPHSLLGTIVPAVAESEEGVWVGTLGGLCLLDQEKGTFTRYNHKEGEPSSLPDNNIRSLYCDDRNRLWIGSGKGFSLHDPKEEEDFINWSLAAEGEKKNPVRAVMSIGETAAGELALGLWSGEVLLFDREERRVSETHILEGNNIYFIYPDGDDIWIGSWGGGLFYLDRKGNRSFRVEGGNAAGSLKGDILYSFLRDDRGNYWIGTKTDGLYRLDPQKRKALLYSHDPQVPGSLGKGEITEILFDATGTLWVGTYANGLYRQSGEGNRFIRYGKDEPYPRKLDVDRVSLLHTDDEGRLWLGSTEGLYRYDEEKEFFEPVLFDSRRSLEEQDIVYSMAEDRQGNYWIGTYNRGVVVRDRNWENPRYYDNSAAGGLSDNLIAGITMDSAGDIWLATNGGVNLYLPREDRFVHYRYDGSNPEGLNTDHIRGIMEDSRRRLWVATSEGGINLLAREIGTGTADSIGDRWIKYTRKDGLPHNRIMKVMEDSRGELWISTSYGIAVFHREDQSFTAIPREEGFFSPEFSGGAAADGEGNLLFGSNSGVIRFSPDSHYSNREEARTYLTDVRIHRQSLLPAGSIYNGRSLNLVYDQRFIEIHFSALDLLSSGNNRFAYRMDGIDQDWIYARNKTETVYNNLSPGRYTFRVKAANDSGQWSSGEARLYVTVNPPAWLSPLAIGSYIGLGFLFLILLFISVRHRFSLQKIKELEEVKSQLESANNQLESLSLHDGLTGVSNRRRFDRVIRELWETSIRTDQPLALLMIDVDHFKDYNDKYGHLQGDDCLKAIASVFQKALPRTTDMVFRYGGEEFCIILPGTDGDGALLIAERIHTLLREAKISPNGASSSAGVTVSIGIAVRMKGERGKADQFIKRADLSLYRAKENGRDRTII